MKTYIGDGAYAQIGPDGEIILTTDNGIETTNTIVLDPYVWKALLTFVKRAQ